MGIVSFSCTSAVELYSSIHLILLLLDISINPLLFSFFSIFLLGGGVIGTKIFSHVLSYTKCEVSLVSQTELGH